MSRQLAAGPRPCVEVLRFAKALDVTVAARVDDRLRLARIDHPLPHAVDLLRNDVAQRGEPHAGNPQEVPAVGGALKADADEADAHHLHRRIREGRHRCRSEFRPGLWRAVRRRRRHRQEARAQRRGADLQHVAPVEIPRSPSLVSHGAGLPGLRVAIVGPCCTQAGAAMPPV